jgi:hypothetical protein
LIAFKRRQKVEDGGVVPADVEDLKPLQIQVAVD